jgi:FKBP-type peptidyl-prolyl cis-trans isomerase 2
MQSEKSVAEAENIVVDKREKFGAEHISKPKEKSPERKENIYRVIKTRQNQNKLYFFTMGNGHVWRQMERQRILVPKGQAFDVVITQGTFGDYRLRIEGKGRRIRVKRVR